MRNAFQIIFLAALALVTQGTSSLPEKLIIGYANWGECDEKIIEAVENGVNVVIWFAINLVTDGKGLTLLCHPYSIICFPRLSSNLWWP
jgi:hypothetical protein